MSGADSPSGVPHEEMPTRPTARTWLFVFAHVALGAVTAGLAVCEDFADGKATFAAEAWRVVFGLVGAGLVFLSLRGMLRMLNGSAPSLTPERRRRAALRARALIVVGLVFFVVAAVEAVGDETVSLTGWAKPFYLGGGAYLVLVGLLMQWDPTRFTRLQRVARGEGRPGVARIVHASDTGRIINHAPQVKIDFEIEVGGRTYLASDKIVIEQAKLALLIPGSEVDVVVDRVDPNVFHVHWDSWRPPDA